MLTRRRFLELSAAGLTAGHSQSARGGDSVLRVRRKDPAQTIAPGEHALGLGAGGADTGGRDGLLIVPAGYQPAKPAPLVVLLHGAGGRARRVIGVLDGADGAGVIVLAPESRGPTWDAIRGRFGPDVEFVNRAIEHTFDRCAVDPKKIAIGGFSDGATYALSLGLDNGVLFTHILAFSPGFLANRRPQGRPRIFISHGTGDQVLPIDVSSRRLVPALEDSGYPVTYREFKGPHTVPRDIARDALRWFMR
jgi:phospholipase/carboxylesterase